MSKIYDVEKMYGQDFSIVTTNAPSNIIKQAKKLLPNVLLISSPQNSEGEDSDNNLPAMFITDYNAQPLQLTYAFHMANGLNYSDENNYVFINIDNSTITTENTDGSGKLKVETNNLKNASFTNKGVVKLSPTATDIDRNLSANYQLQESISNQFNQSTFISINNEGILYINDDLLSLINNIVDLKIKQKMDSIKIMLNNNFKMWIVIKYINGIDTSLDGKTYNLGSYDSIDIDNLGSINDLGAVSLTFDLYYLSFNNESETVNIIDESNKIYDISFSDDGNQTYVSPVQNNDELYQHTISDITIIFFPNYFIENNETYTQEYQLLFKVDDKEDSLSFRQNKLSNFDDENFNITLSPNSLIINDILNTSRQRSLIEKIVNNGVLKGITYNYNDIIKFNLSTFFIHPSAQFKNIDNYEKYILLDNYEYIPPTTSPYLNIPISNIDDYNNTTLLYNFINSIISPNTSSNDLYNYEIEYNESVPISDTEIIKISDYIQREVLDDKIKYYIGIGMQLDIISDKNIKLGTYSNIVKVELDMNKSTRYGYIYITNNSGNGTINNPNTPKYIYYDNRSSSARILVSNEANYKGEDINTNKLYCIFDGDLNLTNGESNDTKLYINYDLFKQFNSGIDENNIQESNEQDTTINTDIDFSDPLIQNSNNGKITINLSDPDNENNTINQMASSIYTLLTAGNTFTTYFDKNNTTTNIIRSQETYLNINLLNLMLSKISVSNDKSIWKNIGTYVRNLSDPTKSEYYDLNNYVISNDDINNNIIKSIKIGIPNYILISLNNSIQFNISFGCYYNNTIEYVKIIVNRNNNQITANISQNLSDDSLEFEGNYNNFTIDYSNTSSHYIQISVKNDGVLPKLLIMSFSFGINESYKKISYLEDKVISSGTGETLDNSENTNKQIALITNNPDSKIKEIIYVVNEPVNNESGININSLKETLNNENSTTSIKVKNLTIGKSIYTFTKNTISDSTFNLVLGTDSSLEFYNCELGQITPINLKFKYLSNPNNLLDEYNRYCKNTTINGGYKYLDLGYKLRFTQFNVTMKHSFSGGEHYDHIKKVFRVNLNKDQKNGIIFHYYNGEYNDYLLNSNSSSHLGFQNIFNGIFENINNFSGEDVILIDNDDNSNIIENSDQHIMWKPNGYGLYLKKSLYNGNNELSISGKNLYLGYDINILNMYWGGLKNNKINWLHEAWKINLENIIPETIKDGGDNEPLQIQINYSEDNTKSSLVNLTSGDDSSDIRTNLLCVNIKNGNNTTIKPLYQYLKELYDGNDLVNIQNISISIYNFKISGYPAISTIDTPFTVNIQYDQRYNVTFISEGTPRSTIHGITGTSVSAPDNILREGYTLSGWGDSAESTTPTNVISSINTSDVTYYAIWQANS